MNRSRNSEKGSKRILAICGSPRKGNTAKLLGVLADEIDNKHQIEIINLKDLNIQMCTGNDYCIDNKTCHIKDDFELLASKMQNADIIIFASPSYFNNVSALMKNFIDRCNVLWNNEALKAKGKKAVLCAIGGDKKHHVEGCLKALRNLCGGIYVDVMAQLLIEENNIKGSMKQIKKVGETINEHK